MDDATRSTIAERKIIIGITIYTILSEVDFELYAKGTANNPIIKNGVSIIVILIEDSELSGF